MEELSALLIRYQNEYNLGKPTVEDREYDRLFDLLSSLEKESPHLVLPYSPTKRVGSDLNNDFAEFTHRLPVLSLDKAYTPQALLSWMKKTETAVKKALCFVMEEKIDGVSIVLYYEKGMLDRAVTRGNGYVGNDITENVRTLSQVPLMLDSPESCAVRGEIYLPKGRFEAINKTMETPYANPRNLAAGTLRRVKSRDVAKIPLEIFIYEGFFDPPLASHRETLKKLADLGFRINPRLGVFFSDPLFKFAEERTTGWYYGDHFSVADYIRKINEERNSLDYEIDGLVVKVDEVGLREDLGYTGHHPRWAIAYKFEAPEGVTEILGIDVQVGRTGRITPVARVRPVPVGGTTISNITLHNQDYINMLELALGDSVAISRRGDVIPAVERVIEKNEAENTTFSMPGECPSCGTALEPRGAHLFCPNKECPAQIRGRILFFVDRGQMDIASLGPETLDLLLAEGFIRDLEDLYTFDFNRLLGLPGFGAKKVEALKEGIASSKEKPFRVFLPALGIPEIGPKAAELLINAGYGSFKKIFALADQKDPKPLLDIAGIGEKTASTILEEFSKPELRKRISSLIAAGLPGEENRPEGTGNVSGIFSGQTWCVTGSFEAFKPRDLAMEEVKKRGGRVVGQVTGKTTHLLAGSGAGSKLEDASRLGIKVVNEKEFLSLLFSED